MTNRKSLFAGIIAVLLIGIAVFYTRDLLLLHESPTKAAPAENHYSILIDLEEKKLYLLNNGKLYRTYTCAVGTEETPSPLGAYKIIRKSRWGEGFGGYWLGIDCPWGTYGIHGTIFPESVGYAASHGCFRLYNSDIEQLYDIVPYGTPVCITDGGDGAYGCYYRVIEPSMYGLDVQLVQKKLTVSGYYDGACSGVYDSDAFREAIEHYQRDHKLCVTGSVGFTMLRSLGMYSSD